MPPMKITKNMIELTGSAWEDKIVGFLCAAGGHTSYMSVMSYANSLMLDFRCVIIPRFAFATSDAFDGERITDKKSPSESNCSPTNWFASPKRCGAKALRKAGTQEDDNETNRRRLET